MRRRISRSCRPEKRLLSRPSNRRAPEVGGIVRFNIRNSVVLPAPLGPINATRSPRRILRLRSCRASVRPSKTLQIPSSTYMARVALLEQAGGNRRLFGRLELFRRDANIFLGPLQIHERLIRRIVVVQLQEGGRDLLDQRSVQIAAYGPAIIDV